MIKNDKKIAQELIDALCIALVGEDEKLYKLVCKLRIKLGKGDIGKELYHKLRKKYQKVK